MINISACIIARDENNYFFEACLKKLSEFCSEIVVVLDDRTRDGTEELLNKFDKVTFTEFHWKSPSSYTDARQAGLRLCKGDYILKIDADEVFTDNWQLVLEIIEQNPTTECFSLVSEHFIGNLGMRDATYTPHIHMYRIIKNKDSISFPKETMHGLPIGWKGHLTLGSVRFPIIYHYGYCKNILEIKKRYDQNLERLEMHTTEYLQWFNNSHILGTYPVQAYDWRNHPKEIKELIK